MSKSLAHMAIAVTLLQVGLWWSAGAALPALAADTTVSVCDYGHLIAAVDNAAVSGNVVTFTCSGTIHMDWDIELRSPIVIDGGNKVVLDGGGMAGLAGGVFIVGYLGSNPPVSVLLRNLAIVNGANVEGGVIVNYGNLTVNNLTLVNGVANGVYRGGGGIENIFGNLNVIDSTFTRNSAPRGGAIYSTGGTLTVIDSSFYGNSANEDGGAIVGLSPTTITGSTFSGNSAGHQDNQGGGGAVVNHDTMTIVNSTFSGNDSCSCSSNDVGIGGGLYNLGNTTIINSTFSGNRAGGSGSSLFNGVGEHIGTITMRNTILASPRGDPGIVGSNCGKGNPVINGGGNVEDGASCGFVGASYSIMNPNLGPLANNGGPTQTMALPSTSPAVGKGSCATTAPVFGVDQRGYIRPSTHCDPGAYQDYGLQPGSAVSVSGSSVAGRPAVLTATVAGTGFLGHPYPASGLLFPSGTVTFKDGGFFGPVIACAEGDPTTHAVPLPANAALESVTCTASGLAPGPHTVMVFYYGDSIFGADWTSSATFTVQG